MGGGKVTPITLFDDNAYSNQSETDEEDDDDDLKKTRGAVESSVYLGKRIHMQRSSYCMLEFISNVSLHYLQLLLSYQGV